MSLTPSPLNPLKGTITPFEGAGGDLIFIHPDTQFLIQKPLADFPDGIENNTGKTNRKNTCNTYN